MLYAMKWRWMSSTLGALIFLLPESQCLLTPELILTPPSTSLHRSLQPTTGTLLQRNPIGTRLRLREPPQSTSQLSLSRDDDDNDTEERGRGTIPKLTTSLVKSIIGSGVLALPAAVATLGDSPAVIPYAAAIIIFIGLMNAYYFRLIGQICEVTGSQSYQDAWEKTVVKENNEKHSLSSQLVAISVALKTGVACLSYSMILADSFLSLGRTAGLVDLTRSEALLGVTIPVLLPLCLLKDLTALTPFSFLGLIGVGVASGSIILRHLDGSYAFGGQYLNDIDKLPAFGDTGPQAQGVVLACTLATAFVAHYNAPRFHSELNNNTPARFDTVIATSYAVATVVFILVASQGFLTFGASSAGLILNSYSPFDPLVTASRVAVAASILFAFPLPFVGFRDGMLDVLQIPREERDEATNNLISLILLAAVTVAADVTRDLALVLAVGGGTLSTAISSIFPTLMYRSAATGDYGDRLDNAEWNSSVSLGLMCVSVAIGATGVWIAIEKALHSM